MPREILKFSFSKVHILRILRDVTPKLTVKTACIWQQIDIYFRNFSTVNNWFSNDKLYTILLLSVAAEIIPVRVSLYQVGKVECCCRNLSKISPVRRYGLINVYTYDFKKFRQKCKIQCDT